MTQQTMQNYQQEREWLLATIVETLSHDERFVAAWLTGSYGRGEADAMSDIDITFVVDDKHSDTLCSRELMTSAASIPERLALFSQFGELAIVHENNNNAPEGGTFTFTAYHPAGIMVDWILIPQTSARRPNGTRLLFDQAGIPEVVPAPVEVTPLNRAALAEQVAFFWMMAAVTAKYLARGDQGFATSRLELLTRQKMEIERQLAGRPWRYLHGSQTVQLNSADEQAEALLALCREMTQTVPDMAELGENDPQEALAVIEGLLALR